MKHIKTLNTQTLNQTVKKAECGECQTSCQSACKTSCTVGNQNIARTENNAALTRNLEGRAAMRVAALCLS